MNKFLDLGQVPSLLNSINQLDKKNPEAVRIADQGEYLINNAIKPVKCKGANKHYAGVAERAGI